MSNTLTQFPELIASLASLAARRFQRQLVILSGERAWAYHLLATVDLGETLQFGDQAVDVAEYNRAWKKQFLQKQLGKEFQTIIFDAYQGFDPDLFAALSGTLRGGGLCFLITPWLEQWAAFNDPDYCRLCVYPFTAETLQHRFLSRMAAQLGNDSYTAIFRQTKTCEQSYDYRPPAAEPMAPVSDRHVALQDQHQLVAQLHECVKSTPATAVVMADRGRGKSAALGMLAATLMRERACTILLTAPQRDAVQSVFQQLDEILGTDCCNRNRITYGESSVQYLTPDALIAEIDQRAQSCHVLLVDEAAAMPNYQLQKMVEHFPRLVFSTTVHGYEGSGRSFALRFLDYLQLVRPGYLSLNLSLPIRWAAGDALEQALNLSFCFKSDTETHEYDADQLQFCELSRDVLADDETLLQALFALLVNAHYRTRPSDLRQLLDAPNLRVFALRQQYRVLGVILLSMEGEFDAALAASIACGERRPQGHLLPQSLAVQCALDEALTMRAARIMRIAVTPQLQGLGLGSQLLAEVEKQLRLDAVDYLGTSFGAYAPLLSFWQHNGYQAVSLGTRRDSVSGEYAVLMVRALSSRAATVIRPVIEQFPADFIILQKEFHSDLDRALQERLTGKYYDRTAEAAEQDRRYVRGFVAGRYQYDYCFAALYRYLESQWQNLVGTLDDNQRRLLQQKILEFGSWQAVGQQLQLSGRRGVIAALRHAYAAVLAATGKRSK